MLIKDNVSKHSNHNILIDDLVYNKNILLMIFI